MPYHQTYVLKEVKLGDFTKYVCEVVMHSFKWNTRVRLMQGVQECCSILTCILINYNKHPHPHLENSFCTLPVQSMIIKKQTNRLNLSY